jgi:hypothetical protein
LIVYSHPPPTLGNFHFLLDHGYVMGNVDRTLFTLKHDNDFLLVQIYMEDIIFSGSSPVLISSFQEMMQNEFHMSMMGELTFFLGIQVKQTYQGNLVHQAKYTKELMKKFDMAEAEKASGQFLGLIVMSHKLAKV